MVNSRMQIVLLLIPDEATITDFYSPNETDIVVDYWLDEVRLSLKVMVEGGSGGRS